MYTNSYVLCKGICVGFLRKSCNYEFNEHCQNNGQRISKDHLYKSIVFMLFRTYSYEFRNILYGLRRFVNDKKS